MSARVLLVRPRPSEATEPVDRDAQALRKVGIDVTVDPYLEVAPIAQGAAVVARIEALLTRDSWLVATSAMGPRCLRQLGSLSIPDGVRAAAVGPSTAAELAALGFIDVVVPERATGADLAERLLHETPATAVIPQGDRALPIVAERLRTGGWTVHTEVVYTTRTIATRPSSADALEGGAFDAVVLRSPSAATAVREFAPHADIAAVVSGPTTRAAAESLGLRVLAEAADSSAAAVADAVLAGLRVRMRP